MRVVVPSTFRFHTEIGSTDMTASHARWVAGYLLSRKLERVTARDIGRAYRELRGKEVEILLAMDLLDHAGWVIRDPARGAKGGSWLVNPAIHETFKAQAAAEQARREAIREKVSTPSPRCSAASANSVPNVNRPPKKVGHSLRFPGAARLWAGLRGRFRGGGRARKASRRKKRPKRHMRGKVSRRFELSLRSRDRPFLPRALSDVWDAFCASVPSGTRARTQVTFGSRHECAAGIDGR